MEFYIVDVFAEEKYQGNQLAVVIPDKEITKNEMQKIANEINYNETTFILSDKLNNGRYDVRIFTPDTEVPFAGHPTIGTAFILKTIFEKESTSSIILNLKVGQITVYIENERLTMKQNEPQFGDVINDKTFISELLSVNENDIDDSLPIQIVSTGLPALIVPVKSNSILNKCEINHKLYKSLIENVIKSHIIIFSTDENNTSKSHINTRVFLDDSGFPEDPATGSANGNLGAYLAYYNFFESQHLKYTSMQGIKMNRPSKLNVEVNKINDKYNIMVGGKSFLVAKGVWLL
ncbi:PhzF family phenazine biosynthesis protein [Staphylococcus succinus]|uniref:PhzF family phenazine biosynthesis protein n=1 Tax=Staphylococcus succinus TaxID=61015 RepID=UPI001C04FB56|nr:PhzF family phenazine biosynthesis protein [Staphylococcus succinus]MBU0437731.1 PhzF family phenazine biosynthesis protein [Staphylococcus succinus]